LKLSEKVCKHNVSIGSTILKLCEQNDQHNRQLMNFTIMWLSLLLELSCCLLFKQTIDLIFPKAVTVARIGSQRPN